MTGDTTRPEKINKIIVRILLQEVDKLNRTFGSEWNYHDLKRSFLERMNTRNYTIFERDLECLFFATPNPNPNPNPKKGKYEVIHCYGCKITFEGIYNWEYNAYMFENTWRCFASDNVFEDRHVNFCSKKCYLQHYKDIVFE